MLIVKNSLTVRTEPTGVQRWFDAGRIGGGNAAAVGPSLVDAALICKEFLTLRHVIECGLLSGLYVRPVRCRWPRW